MKNKDTHARRLREAYVNALQQHLAPGSTTPIVDVADVPQLLARLADALPAIDKGIVVFSANMLADLDDEPLQWCHVFAVAVDALGLKDELGNKWGSDLGVAAALESLGLRVPSCLA